MKYFHSYVNYISHGYFRKQKEHPVHLKLYRMFSLALLFFISYCRVILPLCLPCWLLLQSLFPVHRQVPARNGQMYKRNHRLHLSWNEVWLHIRKSPVPEHLLLRWYIPVYPVHTKHTATSFVQITHNITGKFIRYTDLHIYDRL